MSLLDCFGFLFRSRHHDTAALLPERATARRASDPHNLDRFLEAQKPRIHRILSELSRSRVETDWMWYVFPQLKGCGRSQLCDRFGITSLDEARAYLGNAPLAHRLLHGVRSILDSHRIHGLTPDAILGNSDRTQKFWASITLFAQVSTDPLFKAALTTLFTGQGHPGTLRLLAGRRHEEAPEASGGRPFDAGRFLDAQTPRQMKTVMTELQNGKKQTHWMWFVFPQMAGLGRSDKSKHFALHSRDQVMDYLQTPKLKTTLSQCLDALLVPGNRARSAAAIFGRTDAQKLHSSLTMFYQHASDLVLRDKLKRALDQFFDGSYDERTMTLLGTPPSRLPHRS